MSNLKRNIYVNFFPSLLLKWDEKTVLLHLKNLLESFSNKDDCLFFVETNGVKLDFVSKLETDLDNVIKFSPAHVDEEHSAFHLVFISNDKELNTFLDRLDNCNFGNSTSVDKLRPLSAVQLSTKHNDLLKTKSEQIEKKLGLLKSETAVSGKTLQRLESSEFYLEIAAKFNPFFTNVQTDEEDGFEYPTTFFYEKYRLLLFAEVEFNYAQHINVDPVLGWINPPKDITDINGFDISNPFLSFVFDDTLNGVLKNVEYFPKKESISGFRSSLFFTGEENPDKCKISSISSNIPTIMRKSPDLYGIKFIEEYEYGDSKTILPINKIFYLRSGLTPAGNYSTTGFELDLWIDEKANLNSALLEETIHLHFSHSFNCESELVNFRHLTDVGGVSSEVHSTVTENITLKNSEYSGQLKGVRTIDSVNQFVTDYRFTCSTAKIIISPSRSKIKNRANFYLTFAFKIKDIYDFDNSQKFVFTIY